VLYVSEVLLDDHGPEVIDSLLRQFDVANELRQVGKQPLLLTTDSLLLMLEWLGPHDLTEEGILVNAPDKAGVYLLVEPLEAGRWRPFFVDRHSNLSSHLELFARTKELGRVRGYFCALVDTVMPGAEVVRDRSVKFIAEACGVEDPIDPELPLLAVTLPLGLERRRSCSG
jgi:hypothetical protein